MSTSASRARRVAAAGAPRDALTRIGDGARQQLREWFGRDVPDATIRAMVGAPADAEVRVSTSERIGLDPTPIPAVDFHMYGPVREVAGYQGQRRQVLEYGNEPGGVSRHLMRQADGSLLMINDTFRVDPAFQKQGLGTRIFAREVKTLALLGVRSIGAAMAGWRGSSDQGYYVWPLLGYDTKPGQLPEIYEAIVRGKSALTRTQIDERFPGLRKAVRAMGGRAGRAMTLHQLYRLPGGRAYWKDQGRHTSGEFDLRPGSPSMRTLRAYLDAKGIDWSTL